MTHRLSLLFTLLAAAPMALPGCASVDGSEGVEEESVETSEEALSAVNLDLRGTITLGASTSLAYRTSTKYAAYSLVATKGDLVDLRVHSPMLGNGMLYLLDSSYRTVASNSSAIPRDLMLMGVDPHLQTVIPSTGTYYVAFRYPESEQVTLWTSLLPNGAPTSDDPFDPGSCPGAALTFKEAVKYVAKQPHNAKGAPYTLMVRRRACSDPSCAWTEPKPAEPKARYGGVGPSPRQQLRGYLNFYVASGDINRGSRADRIALYTREERTDNLDVDIRGVSFLSREVRVLPQSTPLQFLPDRTMMRYTYGTQYVRDDYSWIGPAFKEAIVNKTCTRIVSDVSYDNEQFALLARYTL
ncbi:MAG: hypothetical protein U0174_27285 [Polyangiaceae bacterium]